MRQEKPQSKAIEMQDALLKLVFDKALKRVLKEIATDEQKTTGS